MQLSVTINSISTFGLFFTKLFSSLKFLFTLHAGTISLICGKVGIFVVEELAMLITL